MTMLLAYNHARAGITVAGGTLVTAADALMDRRPATITRLRWPSGTMTTSTTLEVRAAFADCNVRCVALLNTTLPAGLKVQLWGKRRTDSGYTYNLGAASQTTKLSARVDGGTGAVWVLPASNAPLVGLAVRIFNDVGGSVALAASSESDIGELVIGTGVDVLIESDWALDGKDPSAVNRTLGAQVARVRRRGYRVLECTPANIDDAEARMGGLGGTDWQELGAILRDDPYVLAIARTGSLDDIRTTSVYGIATRVPSVQHIAGPRYQPARLVIEEVPG